MNVPYKAPKSYENPEFLNGADARTVRILCEYEEPAGRFRRLRINNTIVFFGSARTLSKVEAQSELAALRRRLKKASKNEAPSLEAEMERAKRRLQLSRYYEDATTLARKLTAWSRATLRPSDRFFICTGGGPGIMEAANRGASEAGGRSIGLNVSLPMEQTPNPYQSQELSFEFHYFFMRKFWFVYFAKAIVVFPGGFGTLDEMFELLTLIQTQKTTKSMPVVLYGEKYWKEVVNFEALAKWGTIDAKDLNIFRFSDDPDESYRYLKKELTRLHLKKGRTDTG